MRYIGSKARILDFLSDSITDDIGCIKGARVADLFAGTAVVSDMFKHHGAQVTSNDYLAFSYCLQVEKVKLNTIPKCAISYESALEQLNLATPQKGFFYHEYTPVGSATGEFQRNYFSEENACKIDAMRGMLKNWKVNNQIDDDMSSLLKADLINAVTKVSNISGTYGSFLKKDDPRKYKQIQLIPSVIFNSGLKNESYCEDIFNIIQHVSGDILYLDPPYNTRQYAPYYHILETIAKEDSPAIYGLTGRRPYRDKMSSLCMKNSAKKSLIKLVDEANFSDIFISYSTDGIVNYRELMGYLQEKYSTSLRLTKINRYKSHAKTNKSSDLREILIHVNKA